MSVSKDVDDELRFHFESRIEELIAGGLSPAEARAQTAREFGDVDEVRQGLVSINRRVAAKRSRAERLSDLLGDARYAVRSLSRTPGVALAILVTLALGVGANAAMFTFLETLFLRPPAGIVEPHGLRRLWNERKFYNGTEFWSGYSYPQYAAVADAVRGRAATALYIQPQKVKIGAGESAAEAQLSYATTAYFDILGARTMVGRLYGASEDLLDSPARVAVVSRRYWERALGADRAAIGQTILIAGKKHTVIGVMAEPFTGVDLDAVDVWVPFASGPMEYGDAWWKSGDANGFGLLIRPLPGVDDRELEARITVALRHPRTPDLRGDSTTVARLGSIIKANGPGKQSQEVQIAVRLAGVALLVLIITCANVVNLLLARAVRRRREIAVRLALGIAHGRLIRLLLAESAVIATGAAVLALFIAWLGGTLLRRLLLPDVHWASSPLDAGVVAFALAVALGAGLLAGLVPALQSARPELTNALKAGSSAGGVARSRLRGSLVIVQAALSVLLLVGALLFVRSLNNVRRLDLGFDAPRMMTLTVNYDDRSRSSIPQFGAQLTELASRVATVPGVEHVGLANVRPIFTMAWLQFYTDADSMRRDFQPTVTAVSNGYFAAAGLRMLQGTGFPETPSPDLSVIVNQTMAKIAWPGRSALGQCMRFGKRTEPCYRVIGVVEDSRQSAVIEDPMPKYYLSFDNPPAAARTMLRPYYITLAVDPVRVASVTASLRSLARAQFPGAVPSIIRLSDYLEPQYRPWRLGATLFTAFGVLALVVAVVGIYSTVSYSVNQRTHEFGVRIALGATLGNVLRLVIGGGVRTVAIGIALGIMLALIAGKLVASLLYGVSPSDPFALVLVATALLVVGALAALVPAWRAARVDPVTALRAD